MIEESEKSGAITPHVVGQHSDFGNYKPRFHNALKTSKTDYGLRALLQVRAFSDS